jgi:hypothetical protein
MRRARSHNLAASLLYRSLTDLTCEKAGKAAFDSRDSGDEVERQWREVGLNLRERLRRTAAAMSALGVEHLSREEWKRRVLQNEKVERETQNAEDHPLTRLMISFYFKGGQPEQGCEFAHKSFREYLFTECIVETLKEYGHNLSEREAERLPARDYWRDFSRDEDRLRYEFSRDLACLLAPQWVRAEIFSCPVFNCQTQQFTMSARKNAGAGAGIHFGVNLDLRSAMDQRNRSSDPQLPDVIIVAGAEG